MNTPVALLIAFFGGMNAAQNSPRADVIPLRDAVAQMIMIGVESSEDLSSSPKTPVGGYVLFARDLIGGEDRAVRKTLQALTQKLRQQASIPPFIGIDQEGGAVRRLKEGLGLPPPMTAESLGKLPTEASYDFSRQTAEVLATLGINLNFAPVVDLAKNPDNPVIAKHGRAFSANPNDVSRHARAFVKGHRDVGVLTCLKHFPGHGSSGDDSHLDTVDVTGTWGLEELSPYRDLLASQDVDSVMTAHIYLKQLDPYVPATLSSVVVNKVLRRDLNYRGVVFSDSLQMGAIARHYSLPVATKLAILAGVDVLLFTRQSEKYPDLGAAAIEWVLAAVKRGEIQESRIRESYQRIIALKSKLNTQVKWAQHSP